MLPYVAPPLRGLEVVRLRRTELPGDTVALARFLLGKVLVRDLGPGRAAGRIVETEAYLHDDPACHAYRGMTPRNRSLFLEAGHFYVYLCYGTSYMLNVSSEASGVGAGVLLRALEPLDGIENMQRSRQDAKTKDLARGPGRLSTAFQVDKRHDGLHLCDPGPLWIGRDDAPDPPIGQSTRIGLTKGADARLRFFVAGNGSLSGTRRQNAFTP